MKDTTITFSELMKSLDSFRRGIGSSRILTKEQIKFLRASRNHKSPLSYKIMAELWGKAGWGKMPESTMRRIFLNLDNKQ